MSGRTSRGRVIVAAVALVWLRVTGVDRSKSLLLPVTFAIAVALTLDLIYAHYPKPGHVAGVLLGLLIASGFRKTARMHSKPSAGA